MEVLNSAFRELVKKYHPDKVRDHPEWAHERMAEINDAYETLAAWIASPPREETASGGVDEKDSTVHADTPAGEEAPGVYRRETPPLPASLSERFYPVFHGFLDGLGLYYQYGLEKASYREEGVRRFRFREAFRIAEKNRDSIEALCRPKAHPAVRAAARFARLTVADMDLGEPFFPGTVTAAHKRFDNRLRKARRDFDAAIREILYPELSPVHMRGRAAGALYSSYTEFVLYLTVFTEGERRNAGILQTARYDAFMDLIELRNEGILDF